MALRSVRRSVSARSSSWCSASSSPARRDLAFPHVALGPPTDHGLYRLRRRGRLAPRAHQRELRVAARALGRGLGLAGLAVGQLGVAETVEPGAELAGADLGVGALAARGGQLRLDGRAAIGDGAQTLGLERERLERADLGHQCLVPRLVVGAEHAVDPGLELAHPELEPALLLAQGAALLGQRLEPALLRDGLGLLALEPDAATIGLLEVPGSTSSCSIRCL